MVDVDVDDLNDTPLHLATRSGDHDKMLTILKSVPCDPNAIGLYGWAPLHEAIAKGDFEGATILLQHGAVPHRRDLVNRDSPLHMAAKYGNIKMLKLMLVHGADLEVTNQKGEMPIDVASGDCIQLLEKYGCVKNAGNGREIVTDKMKVTRTGDPFDVKYTTGLESYLITPEEVGLAGPARKCGSVGQPFPQVTLAVQYNNDSVKIFPRTIQDVFIPTQLVSEYTHLLMEVSIQPDSNKDTIQTTEELPLTEHLQDNTDSSDDHKHLQLVLPFTFNTHPLFMNIKRDKMDGRCVRLRLCLSKSWGYGSSMVTIASTDIPLSSAIKLVTPHTFYLTHTKDFLSHC